MRLFGHVRLIGRIGYKLESLLEYADDTDKMNDDMKCIGDASKKSLPIIGQHTTKSKKWRFSVTAPVYTGIENIKVYNDKRCSVFHEKGMP